MSIEALAQRIRRALAASDNVTERRMFGGVAFMIDGNLALSASPNGLLVRVGVDSMAAALKRRGARPMQMGERTMRGYLFVDDGGIRTDGDFTHWIETALEEVRTLPRKPSTGRRAAADNTRRRRGA
jgi:TfoX/Sxy family transcriptional regulator of competence genes